MTPGGIIRRYMIFYRHASSLVHICIYIYRILLIQSMEHFLLHNKLNERKSKEIGASNSAISTQEQSQLNLQDN